MCTLRLLPCRPASFNLESLLPLSQLEALRITLTGCSDPVRRQDIAGLAGVLQTLTRLTVLAVAAEGREAGGPRRRSLLHETCRAALRMRRLRKLRLPGALYAEPRQVPQLHADTAARLKRLAKRMDVAIVGASGVEHTPRGWHMVPPEGVPFTMEDGLGSLFRAHSPDDHFVPIF